MSGGRTCRDGCHRAGGHWVVVDRECNYSAFSGSQHTPSAYSLVGCLECGIFWRTKAKYVQTLRDAKPEEATVPGKEQTRQFRVLK